MKLISLKNTLLAIVGALLVSQSVQAGTPSFTAGDLLLGFRATGGTGAATYYVINLGQATNFTPSTTNLTLSLGTFGQDMTDIYGANWSSRSDLLWSVGGYTGTNTLFVSKDGGSTAWTGQNTTARNGVVSLLDSAESSYQGLSTATANGTNGVTQTLATANNYASYTTGATSWGAFTSGTLGTNGAVNSTLGLDLYKVTASSVYQGKFSIVENSTTPGASTITFNAVPEPSTYALMVLGGFVLFWSMNRRKSVSHA